MPQRRSISQRLAKARSLERKREILSEWSKSWEQDQSTLIKMLEQAIKHDDYDQLCIATGQLKAVTDKRFTALNRVLQTIGD